MAVSKENIADCDSDEFALTSPEGPRSTCDHSKHITASDSSPGVTRIETRSRFQKRDRNKQNLSKNSEQLTSQTATGSVAKTLSISTPSLFILRQTVCIHEMGQ